MITDEMALLYLKVCQTQNREGFRLGCENLHERTEDMIDLFVENGFIYNKYSDEIECLIEKDDWKNWLDNYKSKLNIRDQNKKFYEITKALSFYETPLIDSVIEGGISKEIIFDYELLQKIADIKNYLYSLQIEINNKLFKNMNLSE